MSKCFPLFLFPQARLPRETVNPQRRRQMGPCHFSDFLTLFPAWKRHTPAHVRQWPQNGDGGCQVSLPCQRPHFPFLEFPRHAPSSGFYTRGSLFPELFLPRNLYGLLPHFLQGYSHVILVGHSQGIPFKTATFHYCSYSTHI